jgi:hypothetical protein
MSKQAVLFDLAPLVNWQLVYAAASATDQQIVDFVAAQPGAIRQDIQRGTGIPGDTLNFRLWELAGRGTGEHGADGLLVAEGQPYRYYARERS